jgi:rhodanese-related sulfurtransferase
MLKDQISISVHDLARLRERGEPHVLLDVRENHELAISQLENAVHIPMSQVPARVAELSGEGPLVVMCHHGGRSMRVVNFLRQSGVSHAVNLDGGIDAWACEIDPAIERY